MKFIVHEEDREYEFLLTPGLYIVGRDPTCDLTLDSKKVSRRHMSCTVTDDGVKIRDLGSRNGIRINDRKVKEQKLGEEEQIVVGDVTLDFKPGAMRGMGGEEIEEKEEKVVGGQPTVEDDEQTPPDGTMVRREDVAPGAQVEKRGDDWYVTDPETGREMQIVPAEDQQEEAQSLLQTRKGRLILASLAGGVVILFLLAAIFGGGEPSGGDRGESVSFDDVFKSAINALEEGDTERAVELARKTRDINPDSDAAEILVDLTRVWPKWQNDFFEHYREIKRLLEALFRNYDSRRLENFVRKHSDLIRDEMRYSEIAGDARDSYEADDYEEAWGRLNKIPSDSAVRERDQTLYENVKESLMTQMQERMRDAANRQDWEQAIQTARKLRDYFGSELEGIDEKVATYSSNAQHANYIENARQAMGREDYNEAMEELGQLPEDSIYASEAKRLRQRAQAGGEFKKATKLYNQGEVDEAIKLLEDLSADGADAMKEHIIEVARLYEKADATEEDEDLQEAQELWQQLVKLESDPKNIFHEKAEEALSDLPAKRKELAKELVERAKKKVRSDEYDQCRPLAERALELDPDDEIGADYLESLKKQGRNDFRHALNLMDEKPEEALSRLKRAMQLLPTDDDYYNRARDTKKEVERSLEQE